MSMYWIYDFPNWQLGVATVARVRGPVAARPVASRPLVRWLLNASPVHNDIVSFVFAGIGVFYGLAMGLIAVATWEDFTDVDGLIGKEAAAPGGPVSRPRRLPAAVPRPARDDAPRLHPPRRSRRTGRPTAGARSDEDGSERARPLEDKILAFEPTSEREKIVHADILRSLDSVVELRRLRLQSVSTGLPASLWSVVLIGALLNIALTYLFWVENRTLHALLVAVLATFIGLLIFLTAAMDNPFRGEFSVSPDAYQDGPRQRHDRHAASVSP